MVILTVAWRNIWRNKLRSLIIIAAIAIGVFAGVFATAFMKGMTVQRIKTAINTEISCIQIHNPKFKEAQDLDAVITNADEKFKKISQIPEVSGVSERIIVNGMASSAETSTGAKIIGIDPEQEIKVTNINKKLIEGKFLQGIKRNPVVVGHKLAEKLNLKLRSKVIFTFQDFNGNLSGGVFRVAGIYKTVNSMFDETNIFVKKSDLRKVSGLPDNVVHEIVINLKNINEDKITKGKLVKLFPNLEIELWTELQPELAYLAQMMNMYMYIFVGIILFALGFGIVNTMLMAVLERVKELGMLLAVGMNRKKVFNMIVLETVFLSLVGGILGLIMGYLVSNYYSKHPINLSMWSKGLSNWGWDSYIYTSISMDMLFNVTIMVVITSILAAIYPAIKALKLNPGSALRME